MIRWPGALVAIAGASAVALGAFGAHALRNVLTPGSMEIWHTAVQYHFWHALALALAVMIFHRAHFAREGQKESVAYALLDKSATIAAILFTIGIVLFCGSLYALALGAPRWVGAITPLGGIAFIAGWIALGIVLNRSER